LNPPADPLDAFCDRNPLECNLGSHFTARHEESMWSAEGLHTNWPKNGKERPGGRPLDQEMSGLGGGGGGCDGMKLRRGGGGGGGPAGEGMKLSPPSPPPPPHCILQQMGAHTLPVHPLYLCHYPCFTDAKAFPGLLHRGALRSAARRFWVNSGGSLMESSALTYTGSLFL